MQRSMDDNAFGDRNGDVQPDVPEDTRAPRQRSRRWVIGVLAVCVVLVIASAVFAWTKAGARDDAQRAQDRASRTLHRERTATAAAERDLISDRNAVAKFEQTAQTTLSSAQAGTSLLDQLRSDNQALQTAGTNLGTREAENAYNDDLHRLNADIGPLGDVLTPVDRQIAALRTAAP
jgi:hypothetical protein